ncbi:reverse transcriptase domain-containing protein [Tanacetum coccineum]
MPNSFSDPQAPKNFDDLGHGPLSILPMGNGCARATPRSPRKGWESKGWVDELPNVLWAHQTSLKTSNGETPNSLTFGSEAVIPVEIERREAAAIREAKYKRKMDQYYNKRVRPVSFRVGEHVYRKNKASRVENLGKPGGKSRQARSKMGGTILGGGSVSEWLIQLT